MSVVVYADFTCPECYLAARRTDALAAAGANVEWRAIERERRLPVGGTPLAETELAELRTRFAILDDLLLPGERLPWSAPRVLARSEAAVTAYAEALGAGVGDAVRRLLFDLYWQQGVDIGSPAALRSPLAGPIRRGRSGVDALRYSGYAVSVDRGPITTAAHDQIAQWRQQWRDLGSPQLPVVLLGGATLTGLDALRRLGKESGYMDAPLEPGSEGALPKPKPRVNARPGPHWTSRVGEPSAWAFTSL